MKRKWLKRKWAKRVKYHGAEPMARNNDRRGLTLHNEGVDRTCSGKKGGQHDWLAGFVNSKGIPYHCLWCPVCGWWCQMVPFDKAARSLKGGGIAGTPFSANKYGYANIQVCVVGFGHRDFTKSPMKNAWVLDWIMRQWSIPRRARKTWGAGSGRSLSAWKQPGIHGHQHSPAPGENHTDPNSISITRLFRAMSKR